MSTDGGSPRIDGIHHVTAIASGPQPNLDFYIRFLGLRLVKRTVNFDDPGTYHFYYGDDEGRPGTILTFFPWPGARRGRQGAGQAGATAFAVPPDALGFWAGRAGRFGIHSETVQDPFGRQTLRLKDPDGLPLELVETGSEGMTAEGADVPADDAVRGIDSTVLAVADAEPMVEVLQLMGYKESAREGDTRRFQIGSSPAGAHVDVTTDAPAQAHGGAGTVHHVAFRTPDDASQLAWQRRLMEAGLHVSPVMDRCYFQSIYFRTPGGILFEIATDPPGFTVDETPDELGSGLRLPPMYESSRERIEASLPPVTIPTTGLLTESY
jgi:catechol 2,3-dioxygenase-like lactoylglutathione lyase family enzyme